MTKDLSTDDLPFIIDDANSVCLRQVLEGYEVSTDIPRDVALTILQETKLDAVVVMGWDAGCILFTIASTNENRINGTKAFELFHQLAEVINREVVR